MAGFPGGPLDQQRLDSWKEIGAFFGRDERTVKRWERERGLPVHRVPGSGRGRVYAYSHELKEWLRGAGAEALESAELERAEPGSGETAVASEPAIETHKVAEHVAAGDGGGVAAANEAAWSGEERRKPAERVYREPARESARADIGRGDGARAEMGRSEVGRSEGALAARLPDVDAGSASNGRLRATDSDSGAGTARSSRLALVHSAREGASADAKNATGNATGAASGSAAGSAEAAESKTRSGLAGVGWLRGWAVAAIAVAVMATGAAGYIVHREHAVRDGARAGTAAGHAEAEDLYLKGVYYWQKRTPQSLQQAVDYFTQAIVHDPGYAPAYAGLAECYDLLREYSSMPEAEAYPRAISAAERAIQLDPNLAQAHSALGFALFWWQRDIPRAVAELKKGVELDPRSATAHHWYATALMNMGNMDEALKQIEMAQKLDPGSEAILADKAFILWQAGKREEGKGLLQQLETSDPSYISPHHYLGDIAFAEGDGHTYIAEMRAGAALKPDAEQARLADVAEKAFASGGWPAVLQTLYSEAQQRYAAGKAGPMEIAVWEARMGHRDQALYYLGEAVKANDPGLMYLKVDPVWDKFRDSAQYKVALEKAGLA